MENENDGSQGGTAYIEFVSEVDLEKALFYHDEHYGESNSVDCCSALNSCLQARRDWRFSRSQRKKWNRTLEHYVRRITVVEITMKVEIPEHACDLDRVRRSFCRRSIQSKTSPLGSRSRSPKERDTRRYPPREEMNGDNGGGSYQRRPRYNEGKSRFFQIELNLMGLFNVV